MIYRLLVGLSVVGTVAAGTLAFRGRTESSFPARVDPDLVDHGESPWTVVAFSSPMCRACKQTPSIVADALEIDEAQLGNGASPVGFQQIDVREREDLVEALDVTRTPTVALVDRNGAVRFAREGNPSADELATVLEPPVGV